MGDRKQSWLRGALWGFFLTRAALLHIHRHELVALLRSSVWAFFLVWAVYLGSQSFAYYYYTNTGKASARSCQDARAEQLLLLALFESQAFGEHDFRHLNAIANLGEFYLSRSQYGKAEELFHRYLLLQRERHGEEDAALVEPLYRLAAALYRERRYDRSLKLLDQALSIERRRGGGASQMAARLLCARAQTLRRQGRFTIAERDYREAMRLWRDRRLSHQPEAISCRSGYARLLRLVGKDAEAAAMEREVKELRAKKGDGAQAEFAGFVEAVTGRWFDRDAATFGDSVLALLTHDLTAGEALRLQRRGLLPATREQLERERQRLAAGKEAVSVRIEDVSESAPDCRGFVPITVEGQVSMSGPGGRTSLRWFCLRYLVAVRSGSGDPVVVQMDRCGRD